MSALMRLTLILAIALTSQCPGGRCSVRAQASAPQLYSLHDATGKVWTDPSEKRLREWVNEVDTAAANAARKPAPVAAPKSAPGADKIEPKVEAKGAARPATTDYGVSF